MTIDLLAALLRGQAIAWSAFAIASAEFMSVCREHGVTGLVHERVRNLPEACEWPRNIREELAGEVRTQAGCELLRYKELVSVIDVLAAHGLSPIILKGTALAYSRYNTPSDRPRVDTDLLIARDQVDRFRQVMTDQGYSMPLHCQGDLLFCQFPLVKTTKFGITHQFDCHWKISTQSVFADAITYDEADARAISLPALGAHARTLATIDALLLACIHPVMHHRNAEPLIWTYDVHLLASALSEQEFEGFTELAIDRKVSTICAHQLRAAHARLGTRIPESCLDRMTAARGREPSAAYLQPDRQWLDELVSSIRGLPRWTDRVRLLREVVFPGRDYMLKAYGLARLPLGVAIVPVLYLHRILFGAWKVVAGHK